MWAVSYTHLDVYKRQDEEFLEPDEAFTDDLITLSKVKSDFIPGRLLGSVVVRYKSLILAGSTCLLTFVDVVDLEDVV